LKKENGRKKKNMDVSLLLRVAGVGMLVAVSCQVLSKSGKDEQALLLTLTGMVLVLIMLIGQIGELIAAVRAVFGL
jgi:stage III sporulation protein AC